MTPDRSLLSTVVILFLFLCAPPCCAQDYIDIARITYSRTPANSFDSSQVSTDINEWWLDVTLPIPVNDRLAIVTGLMGESLQAKVAPEQTGETTALLAGVKAGINYRHSDRLSALYMFLPKMNGDFDGVAPDFQPGGMVLMKYRRDAQLTWNFGMYYNSELFGHFAVPLVGCYYLSPSKRFEINATLPVSADMNYNFRGPWTCGGQFLSGVKSFRITVPEVSDLPLYWTKSTNEIYAYLQWRHGSFIAQARAGYSVARQYEAYNEHDRMTLAVSAFKFGDDRTMLNQHFADGPVFQFRVIYRYFK